MTSLSRSQASEIETASVPDPQRRRVLAALAGDEFVTTRRYESLPILAGSVNAPGLAKLIAHPSVASVIVDGIGSIATDQTLPIINAPELE